MVNSYPNINQKCIWAAGDLQIFLSEIIGLQENGGCGSDLEWHILPYGVGWVKISKSGLHVCRPIVAHYTSQKHKELFAKLIHILEYHSKKTYLSIVLKPIFDYQGGVWPVAGSAWTPTWGEPTTRQAQCSWLWQLVLQMQINKDYSSLLINAMRDNAKTHRHARNKVFEGKKM